MAKAGKKSKSRSTTSAVELAAAAAAGEQSNKLKPEELPEVPAPEALGLDLGSLAMSGDDGGLSLEELSEAYAALMGGADPYMAAPPPADGVAWDATDSATDPLELAADDASAEEDSRDDLSDAEDVLGGDNLTVAAASGRSIPAVGGDERSDLEVVSPAPPCEITPRSILEAMLFVGHPGGQPLTAKLVSSLMRGVRPREIDDLIQELNEAYEAEDAPYRVESVADGYQLLLRRDLHGLRDVFYGRVKEAKLSQAAIDVLAVVAYNQPLTRPEIDRLRNAASASLLSQLVRRGLLRVERPDQKPREPIYYTTERFLELFQLQSLDELPRSQDPDRGLLGSPAS